MRQSQVFHRTVCKKTIMNFSSKNKLSIEREMFDGK